MGAENSPPCNDENENDVRMKEHDEEHHQEKKTADCQEQKRRRQEKKKQQPRTPQYQDQKEKATEELLRLLSTEIAKDGGASLVTSIKDYLPMSGKRFNMLLYHAIGKAKLLRFLEYHSTVFAVDRNSTPHFVQLLSREHVQNDDDDEDDDNNNNNSLQSSAKHIDETLQTVRNKASYVLQKRQAKLNRRQKKQKTMNDINGNDNNDGSNITENVYGAAKDTTTVNLSWLLHQSVGDFHLYLRACGFYHQELFVRSNESSSLNTPTPTERTKVPLVGSRPWEDLVLSKFGQILQDDPESRFSLSSLMTEEKEEELVGTNDKESGRPKVWLSHLDPSVTGAAGTNGTNGVTFEGVDKNEQQLDEEYLDSLEECLLRLVHQDGGHEVRLELLLHRHLELKMALGGRDFSTIYQKFGDNRFQSISCRKEGADWIFVSTETVESKYGGGGRMMVDEVGLYSVTNSKWGTAIGNIMVQYCKTTLGDKTKWNRDINDTTNDSVEKSSKKLTLVDLTASVGGMTLGLAKTEYFDSIVAYEVDPERAKLCEANMKRHDVDGIVQVRNQDSVEALSCFPPSNDRDFCFVIDPPWGGVGFKQKTKRYSQFFMGPWSLKDVLVRMYNHCKPCLVGMRLPEDRAKVNDLLDELREENLRFETKTVRKLSVQRFVVLYFLPDA